MQPFVDDVADPAFAHRGRGEQPLPSTRTVSAMATCEWCDQEMTVQCGCTVETYSDFNDGIQRRRIPHGERS